MTEEIKTEKIQFDDRYRPQDNLDLYVNGLWYESTEIPADMGSYGSFILLRDASELAVREILESGTNEGLPHSKTLYSQFMDTAKIESVGISPLNDLLKTVDQENIDSFWKVSVQNSQRFTSLPFDFGVYNALETPLFNGLHFSQGGLSLPDESYYREEKYAEVRENFRQHIQKIFDLLGYEHAETVAFEVLELETAIASGHWDVVKNRDVNATHNLMALSAVETKLGHQFTSIFADHLDDKTEIDIHQPDFFAHLKDLLTEERVQQWVSWQKYHIVAKFASILPEALNQEFFNFYSRTLQGVNEQPERWKRGVRLAESFVGDEIGKVYIKQHFGPVAKLKMNLLVANLIEAYRISITNVGWLSKETKQKAIEKLSKFNPMIGYPKVWRDYTDFTSDCSNLFELFQNYNHYLHNYELAKVGKKVDKELWHMTPQTVNAYYNPPDNCIVFPAAILQAPFFSEDQSDAQNYGAIGAVIGHEIGHGFDDQGAEFDGDGVLQSWWNESDHVKFKELTDKLNAQFETFVPHQLCENEAYKDGDYHVNGGLTTGENVGDVCGLKIALLAFAISRGFTSIGELVNTDEASVKEFFYSFASIWKQKMRDELMIERLATDPHSPTEFRCNTVRNLDAFHEVFETKVGDLLYLEPKERVNIW